MNKKYKLAIITWFDAHSCDPWMSINEIDGKPKTCESIGWVIKEDTKFVSLAGTIGDDDDCCCVINIPTVCIKTRRNLK